MSDEPRESSGSFVIVARAVRTRGLKGEIVADLLTDFPERFEEVNELFAVAPDGNMKPVTLENYWIQKHRVVLKFAGYENIEAANALVGYDFAVPETERVSLPEDHYYNWELEGCRVENVGGEPIGQVREILTTGGTAVLVIEDQRRREFLVPMAQSIVVEIDVKQKRIRIDPPEGLLEL